MKAITEEELKVIQLDLLQKTADFCEKNGIRYYLCGGTLIGAIRHKGYIPWDDDIDISMPRPDYDRFISIFNKPENYYQVIDMSNDKKYGFPFAKVHDTRTFVDELLSKCLFIDSNILFILSDFITFIGSDGFEF